MTGSCKKSLTDPNNETKFIVHGLWPNKFNDKSPQYCCQKGELDPSVSQISGLKVSSTYESSKLSKHLNN